MPYIFNEIIIRAFDLHTTINPLLSSSEYLNKDFQFLAEPEVYNQAYNAGQSVTTDSFTVKPIDRSEFQENHFWEAFLNNSLAANPRDYWQIQVPFVCQIKENLQLNTGNSSIQASVAAEIFLSALGWSSNLLVTLTGNINSDDLITIIKKIHDVNETPFSASGTAFSLTRLFQRFADKIRSEIYKQPPKLFDKNPVAKYLVISPVSFMNKILYYCPPETVKCGIPDWINELTEEQKMGESDRSVMMSFLYGRKLSIADWVELSCQDVLHTKLAGASFALTNFNRGTFIFMQENAAKKASGGQHIKIQCYNSNVRLYLMMTLFLVNFYNLSKAISGNPKITGLQKNVEKLLQVPSFGFENSVCRNIQSNNPKFKVS